MKQFIKLMLLREFELFYSLLDLLDSCVAIILLSILNKYVINIYLPLFIAKFSIESSRFVTISTNAFNNRLMNHLVCE